MVAKFVKTVKVRIRFESGHEGRQLVNVYDDGSERLAEVVIDRTPKGKKCRMVFGPRSYILDGVFPFADLVPYGQWEAVGPTRSR